MKTKENWKDDSEGKSGTVMKGFSTDIVTDKVIDWIKNRDKNRPFMMCCHFKATHVSKRQIIRERTVQTLFRDTCVYDSLL